MALMVCRDTPSRSASPCWDSPAAARACFMASFFPMPYSFSCQTTAVTARSPQIGPGKKTGNRPSLPMVQAPLVVTKKPTAKCCRLLAGAQGLAAFSALQKIKVSPSSSRRRTTPRRGVASNGSSPVGCDKKVQQQMLLDFWQGHKDLNPEPTVLETAALPIELYPYICKAKA